MQASASSSNAPTPPVNKPTIKRVSRNSILVHKRQEKNLLLEHLRNVAWEYSVITPDFQVGATTCALYLSLRYYRLHPEYLHRRVLELAGQSYKLRILLFHIDAKDPENEIKDLTKYCLINNLTIMAVWSFEEAAMYLQTYKAYENKSPDMIKERIDKDYASILRSALTSIKGVNKTDITTLRTTFGDFASIAHATPEALNMCPGFGKVKARRVNDALQKPFYHGGGAVPDASAAGGEDKVAEPAVPPADEDIDPRLAGKGRQKPVMEEAGTGKQDHQGSPDWDLELDLNSEADNP